MRAQEQDRDACIATIAAIRRDVESAAASVVAAKPPRHEHGPVIIVPRAVGHPESGRLLAAAPVYNRTKASGGNTREVSRSVARTSSILANSPDRITKKLVF